MNTLFQKSGARLSECRNYRYGLWRHWNWQDHANCVMFIGLNPSTADEIGNDMTITKCIGFAQKWGYGGMYMLNLFAFRATDPGVMIAQDDPVGPWNDEAFGYYRNLAGLYVAAWGSIKPAYHRRLRWQERIESALSYIGRPVHCLGKTKDGSPRHPSRLGYSTERVLFWTPRSKS